MITQHQVHNPIIQVKIWARMFLLITALLAGVAGYGQSAEMHFFDVNAKAISAVSIHYL